MGRESVEEVGGLCGGWVIRWVGGWRGQRRSGWVGGWVRLVGGWVGGWVGRTQLIRSALSGSFSQAAGEEKAAAWINTSGVKVSITWKRLSLFSRLALWKGEWWVNEWESWVGGWVGGWECMPISLSSFLTSQPIFSFVLLWVGEPRAARALLRLCRCSLGGSA